MLTESQRSHGMATLGTCTECGRAAYLGPLGPTHNRISLDRDHTATVTK